MLLTALVLVINCDFPDFSAKFDNPVRTEKITLEPDSASPGAKSELTCYSYNRFGIKQVDRGEVGAQSLSLVPLSEGETLKCSEHTQNGEYSIPYNQWTGYFWGVAGDYAIFRAADGTNGGLGFAVFNALTHAKLFEDVTLDNFVKIESAQDRLILHYRRVYQASCSVITDEKACTKTITEETDLEPLFQEGCRMGYKSALLDMAQGRCLDKKEHRKACIRSETLNIVAQQLDASPTVLVYGLQAEIGNKSAVITPQGGVSRCRPAD